MWHKLSLKILVLQSIQFIMFHMIIKMNTDYFVKIFLRREFRPKAERKREEVW